MAVPFNLPEESNEVEVVLNQLQVLVNKLQITIGRYQQLTQQASSSTTSSTSCNSRVRHPSSSRLRIMNGQEVQTAQSAQIVLPDLLAHLWLNNTTSGTTTVSSVRSSQRCATAHSSNPEISNTAIKKPTYNAQDWSKMDCTNFKKPDLTQPEGILSKLMPTSVSSCSLMTAMICFVGWHIFRGR